MHPKVEVIDGIFCYAPDLARENEGFPAESFKYLFALEEANFWFRARNRVLQNFFSKYVSNEKAKVLEVGCGTGVVMQHLHKKFPSLDFTGSEIHLEGLKFAKRRMPEINFVQLDATRMPFSCEFDVVGAYDVVEHIADDELVLSQVHSALKTKGYFFVTVPQYQWMWSVADEIAFHKRRYTKKELTQKLQKAGFEIDYMGSFMFVLFPMMLLSRILQGKKKVNELTTEEIEHFNIAELKLPKFVNRVFEILTEIDVFLIKTGFSLPFGGSLVAVAHKK